MLVPRDELCHYGVKGMKWGVRKSTTKYTERRNKKATKHKEKIHKKVDRFGGLGVAATAADARYNYSKKFATKAITAKVINAAANAYISNNTTKYYRAKGVDYARRAAIFGLGISTYKDLANAYRDVGEAYVHNKKRRAEKKEAKSILNNAKRKYHSEASKAQERYQARVDKTGKDKDAAKKWSQMYDNEISEAKAKYEKAKNDYKAKKKPKR